MATHQDEIPLFIPKGETNLIILGTMGSINARTVNGEKPDGEFFYYNNNRNHFWKVLQFLFEPEKEARKLTIEEKYAFLEKWGIAMSNIVNIAKVPNKDKDDPSDTVLFAAHKKNNVDFKHASPKFKKLLKTKPMFFTCRRKKGIENLLEGFFEQNGLSADLIDHIWYWPTPTRCNPKARSLIWKDEMKEFLAKFSS
ncbi:hypothetical protein DAY19_07815 [Halobacteriovorax vibrionivorans]|uniref:DNA-deoxyinosine glycosylase n=1 Tax=Halobacteriovorax vibrionivorans TaxID=2152716 RepID=A0ABY0IG76_9BACT|nr:MULTISPECIES: hypothetical protein [Halobacteriovorax]RZF21585.1 hypothetical protein DAY19_07815 [Halobacteriovorax vibrionivorans]TGD49122.1 hypothetical protein EP118_01235 [Halobacteriovorax sp. Y22]